MNRVILAGAAALLVAGCSAKPAKPPQPQQAAAMQAGKWEVTARVTAVQLADKTAVAAAKVGDSATTTGCVASDGTPDMKLFVARAKKCEAVQSYAANGRLSMQMNCTLEGRDGQLLPQVDANFTADTLDGTVSSASYSAAGRAEYTISESISGKRVGECAA